MGCREKRKVGDRQNFNKSMRRDSEILLVCVRFGLGRGNETGRELVEWFMHM